MTEDAAAPTDANGFRVVVEEWSASGTAVDCRERAVAADAVVDAIRRPTVADSTVHPQPAVRVACPTPGVVHDHVGVVRMSRSVDVRGALAAVARARNVVVPETAALQSARAELSAVEVPDVDLSSARERVASAEAAAEAVQADVAAARGAVQARDDLDADADVARERLREAVAAASERKTALIAAEQVLSRERERARAARDARSRRLALQDRVGRLERDERDALAMAVWDAFAAAVAAVPCSDGATIGAEPGSFDGADATAALALARIAPLAAPIVVAIDRFETAEAARETLQSPVVLVDD